MDLDRDSSMGSLFDGSGSSSLAPASQAPMFGMVAASAPLRTDFAPVDSTNTKFALALTSPGDLQSPLTLVNELAFFLLPRASNVLPSNSGVLVYWQVEVSPTVQSGYELLGCLIPSDRPSDIFRTGWSEREEFTSLTPKQPVRINIGISIEALDVVKNLAGDGSSISSIGTASLPNIPSNSIAADKRPMVAQKIAKDLYNFMLSFDTGGATGNQAMVVPASIFEKWWIRFESKLRRDPNFFLKDSD